MLTSSLARRAPNLAARAAAAAAAASASAAAPSPSPGVVGSVRTLAMKRRGETERVFDEPIPPNYTVDSIKPPRYWAAPPPPDPEPNEYVPGPVTSAHAVDATADPPRLSDLDSATVGPGGSVSHGRYGALDRDVASAVPLEYLALLRHAAGGAAAVRAVSGGRTEGTVLVYGATQAEGLAATQLASSSGLAVVAVVGGEHSGKDEMVDVVKGLAAEPGTAVPEEYAMVKKNFREIVETVSAGDDPSGWPGFDPDGFLADFKRNLLDYVEFYPDILPAAVSADHMDFRGKEKDRETFRANMEAYLSHLPPGEAPLDPAKLDAHFPKEQYAAWKAKFGAQTTAVISGEDAPDFVPSSLVRAMIARNEPVDAQILEPTTVSDGAGDYVPYEFSVLDRHLGDGDAVRPPAGGPVLGAIVVVTPNLLAAAEAVDAAGPSLRSKAEALQFLTHGQRHAFAAASAVAAEARRAGGAVAVVGGTLPGLSSVEVADEDVREALGAMDVDEGGRSRLNYFVQVYRASDHPVYADYAVHRATEALAGPRQIVVTK